MQVPLVLLKLPRVPLLTNMPRLAKKSRWRTSHPWTEARPRDPSTPRPLCLSLFIPHPRPTATTYCDSIDRDTHFVTGPCCLNSLLAVRPMIWNHALIIPKTMAAASREHQVRRDQWVGMFTQRQRRSAQSAPETACSKTSSCDWWQTGQRHTSGGN